MDPVPLQAPALVCDPDTKALSIQSIGVPEPTGPEEHLIRVHAVAITNGELQWPEPASLSIPIPGYELAGKVLHAPSGSPFPAGTEVYARTGFERQGSARPFSIAMTQELGRKPESISWEEAATVPLSALTAWQALFVHGGLAAPTKDVDLSVVKQKNAGHRVLITAAAGGVGIWAVQLAVLAGAHVVGTCGPDNIEFVGSLGADKVLDYKTTDLNEWVNKDPANRFFNLVLECVGGETTKQAWCSVRSNGLLISIVMPPQKDRPETGVQENVSGMFFIVDANKEQLEEISTLLEQGRCKTVYDSAFPLTSYHAAFERVHAGHLRGKVVLQIE